MKPRVNPTRNEAGGWAPVNPIIFFFIVVEVGWTTPFWSQVQIDTVSGLGPLEVYLPTPGYGIPGVRGDRHRFLDFTQKAFDCLRVLRRRIIIEFVWVLLYYQFVDFSKEFVQVHLFQPLNIRSLAFQRDFHVTSKSLDAARAPGSILLNGVFRERIE